MAILRVAFLSTAVLEFFASVSIALVAVYIGFKLLGVFPFGTGETLTLAEGLTALMPPQPQACCQTGWPIAAISR